MIVFISGSSSLTELTPDMKKCLDKHMSRGASFIVGDCKGGDELAQNYLKEHNYEDVTVYCSTRTPRANRCRYTKFISLWEKAQGKTGEEFYQVKDKAMCEECDIAVAFWNGNSYGVKCNIERCLSLEKILEVFTPPGVKPVFIDLPAKMMNPSSNRPFNLPTDPILGMPHLLV